MMVSRILNTFCCIALLLTKNDEIFSLEFFSLLQSYGYIDPSNKFLTDLLLYGDKGLSNDVNRDTLQLTLQYIHKTGRFD